MVKNDLRCDKLTIQHRMRPEIVKLIVPHVYKHLENHESVSRYENIKGIVGNLFFVKHSYEECSVDDTKSHSNLHEAKFLAALTTYLIKQGYAPEQITVLTTYTGQMFLLRQFMPKSNFEGVRITPVDKLPRRRERHNPSLARQKQRGREESDSCRHETVCALHCLEQKWVSM